MFSQRELYADLSRYDDLPRYLGSMHPRFAEYAKKIYLEEVEDGYVILDKDLKLVNDDSLFVKKIKKDDEFYLVPSITGGGGKRLGNLVKVAAIATAAYFAFPYISSAASSIFAGSAGSSAVAASGYTGATVAAEAGRTAAFSSTLAGSGTAAAGAGLGISASTLALNAGLALVTSLFTQKPEALTSVDQQVRQNNMFGSLQNTIDSGTPIPLVYGMHRVAGQFISGYVDSIDHGKSDEVAVFDQFEPGAI
jgi:hypothetical protein